MKCNPVIIPMYGGKELIIIENPSKEQLVGLYNKWLYVRILVSDDGDIYAWDANRAVHQFVAMKLDLTSSPYFRISSGDTNKERVQMLNEIYDYAKIKKAKRNPSMTEKEYVESLEYAFHDEGKGIEFYNDFLNALPLGKDFNHVRKVILDIIADEERHLAMLATLIDSV